MSKMSIVRVRKNMTICKLAIRDESGPCVITWFNQQYLKTKFITGEKYKFYGKVKKELGRVELMSPVFDHVGAGAHNCPKNTGRIIPLYPLTYELSQNVLRQIIENGLKEAYGNLDENLPEYLTKKYEIMNRNEAINSIHFPENFEEYSNARKRLVFEELLIMQLALLNLKNKYKTDKIGIKFSKEVKTSDIIDNLPFKLTKAQIRVLEEIEIDMESERPMNRLLQGDVGSRKDHCCNIGYI